MEQSIRIILKKDVLPLLMNIWTPIVMSFWALSNICWSLIWRSILLLCLFLCVRRPSIDDVLKYMSTIARFKPSKEYLALVAEPPKAVVWVVVVEGDCCRLWRVLPRRRRLLLRLRSLLLRQRSLLPRQRRPRPRQRRPPPKPRVKSPLDPRIQNPKQLLPKYVSFSSDSLLENRQSRQETKGNRCSQPSSSWSQPYQGARLRGQIYNQSQVCSCSDHLSQREGHFSSSYWS